MPTPLKFKAPSRVLSVRVPAEYYDVIKRAVEALIAAYIK